MTQYGQRRSRKLARRNARRERARRTRAALRALLEHAQAALVVRHVQTKHHRLRLEQAGGKTLEILSNQIGIFRMYGETDASLRERIALTMRARP